MSDLSRADWSRAMVDKGTDHSNNAMVRNLCISRLQILKRHRGRLREVVPTAGIWLGQFWCLDRWSLTGGGYGAFPLMFL